MSFKHICQLCNSTKIFIRIVYIETEPAIEIKCNECLNTEIKTRIKKLRS